MKHLVIGILAGLVLLLPSAAEAQRDRMRMGEQLGAKVIRPQPAAGRTRFEERKAPEGPAKDRLQPTERMEPKKR